MSENKKIKIPRGITGIQSGTTANITVSKNGVITISKKSSKLAKK